MPCNTSRWERFIFKQYTIQNKDGEAYSENKIFNQIMAMGPRYVIHDANLNQNEYLFINVHVFYARFLKGYNMKCILVLKEKKERKKLDWRTTLKTCDI